MAIAALLGSAGLLADESFVDFHDRARAAHGSEIAGAHGLADAMREEPRRLVLNLKHAMQLVRANALLGRAKKMNGLQALMQRDVSAFENRADLHGELFAAIRAFAETDARLAKVVMLSRSGAAMRANRAVRPQDTLQMGEGLGFVVEVGLRENGH